MPGAEKAQDAKSASPFDLTGRMAVVTGATSGIGAGIAVALATAGADIIAVSRGMRPDDHIRGTVETLGRRYEAITADLSQRESVCALAESLGERRIDILVNNAGAINRSPAESHSDALWDEVVEVNLSSQFVLAREVGRRMISRGSGKIILLASMQSFQGGLDIIGYTSTKAGVVGMIHALANEWARHGVNVNGIAPGYIETGMTAKRSSDPMLRAQVTERIPAGRWGLPIDLGGAAVFLASSASDYIHGAVLPVDGGWLVR